LHKSDILQVPALFVWGRKKPFLGSATAAKALLSAATQQVELSALQVAWRNEVAQTFLTGLPKAKEQLRVANGKCNMYIEAAIKSKAAVDKHMAAVATTDKAKAALAKATEAAEAAKAALDAPSEDGLPADGDAPGDDVEKEKARRTKEVERAADAESKKRAKVTECETVVASLLIYREAAEKELAEAKGGAEEAGGSMLAEAEAQIKASFVALHTGYEKMAHSAKGMVSSPEFGAVMEAYQPEDETAAGEAKEAPPTEAVAAVAIGEVKEDGAEQDLSVEGLIAACKNAERAAKVTVKSFTSWARGGLQYQLGPKATDKDAWKCEAGVIGKLSALISSPEARAVVEKTVLEGRADMEAAFGSTALAAFSTAVSIFQTEIRRVSLNAHDWQSQRHKAEELRRKLEAKAVAAAKDADLPDDDKRKAQPPSAEEQKELAVAAAAVGESLKALMGDAATLNGEGDGSVDALFVKPLQALMTALTDLVCSRPLGGHFEPPSDGVVHLDVEVMSTALVPVNVATYEAVEEEVEIEKEVAADGAKWAAVRDWSMELFGEDPAAKVINAMKESSRESESEEVYLAIVNWKQSDVRHGLAITNWSSFKSTGETLIEDKQVIAKGEALGFEVIAEEEPTASIDLEEEAEAEDKAAPGAAEEEAAPAAPAPAAATSLEA